MTCLRGPSEEEFARQGFFGPASHLYHSHAPTEWIRIEGPLRPRAYDLREVLAPDAADPAAAVTPVLGNQDVRIQVSKRTTAMPYCYRNADSDLIYFVHRGAGEMLTDLVVSSMSRGTTSCCRAGPPTGYSRAPARASCW